MEKVMGYQNPRDMLISRDLAGEYAKVAINHKRTAAQAERLQLIRERIHKIRTQGEMAKKLSVDYKRYNNWERGNQGIPAESASKIKAITPGVDLDYILEGQEGGLTVDALKKLKGQD